MKKKNEAGFSLVELLLVITCIGVIASISINYYIKAKISAENTSAVATLSLIRQNEVIFFTQNRRFGRLDEINALHGNIGNIESESTMVRGSFKYDLMTDEGTPTASDNKSLAIDYKITATRVRENKIPYVFTLDHSGVITRVLPGEGALGE